VRRWVIRSSAVVLMLAASTLPWDQVAGAGGAPVDVGSWATPFTVPIVAIHATLLHDGTVLLFERTGTNTGTRAYILDPVTGTTTSVNFNRAREIFCAGHNVMPNGDVFVTGGHPPHGQQGVGVPETEIYRAATRTWEPGPNMGEARWYPTNIELADGRSLIFGGQAVKGAWSKSVEQYQPSSGTLSVLPASATKQIPSYPRMHLLPNGTIFMAGPNRLSYVFNPATAKWTASAKRYGANGSSVLLSDLHSVLAVGGKVGTSATATSEIVDVNTAKPVWTQTTSLNHAREALNLVTLADGSVFAVGGGLTSAYDNPILTPELFDPHTRTWKDMAPQVAPRMYHSTALLLPDGRVLSAGQDKGAYAKTVEIYSPPYLFKGPRPTIDFAPSSLGYGEGFSVVTLGAPTIGGVALVRPGSVTHSVNFDQRYVPLAFNASGGVLSVTSPADGNTAPPGWYMLFLVSTEGIPSVASWVHLT
jgi:hypothetical protein